MAIDLSHFEHPWEHVRLLSDGARNQAMVSMLEAHAPGAVVLEVGCGTGLLSCVAAKLGAKKVYAVEPTPLVEVAQAMVDANGLSSVVEVLRGRVEDLEPRPVDLAFSELLNADPFVEGVLPAMQQARRWLREGGRLAPRRMEVWAAAVPAPGFAREVRDARREVAGLAQRHGLVLDNLDGLLAAPGPTSFVREVGPLRTEPVRLWDLTVGVDHRPESLAEVRLPVRNPGPTGGLAIWFVCELADGVVLHNKPGSDTHWGQLVCGWPAERGLGLGQELRVAVDVSDEGVLARPL